MSEPHDNIQSEITDLADRYLQNELDEQGLARLERLLHDHPQAAMDMVHIMRQAGMMREIFAGQHRFAVRAGQEELDAHRQASQAGTTDPILSLAAMEDSAVAQIVELDAESDTPQPLPDHCRVSAYEVLSVAGYVMRDWVNRRSVGIGLAAALLALAATVYLMIPNGEVQPRVVDQDSPRSIAPAVQPVATLTAQHNTRWAYLNRKHVGAGLYPGDQLTLVSGLAEITTRLGAKVVLQGPCTVEMIDHDNALRLISGRLVGRVETDAAKQFTVRTPSRDVIDLGTEFGVEVLASGETGVYVFEGKVVLAKPGTAPDDTGRSHVFAGQGRLIDHAGQVTPVADTRVAAATFLRSVDPGQEYKRIVMADRPLVFYRFEGEGDAAYRNHAADRYHARALGDSKCVTQGGLSFLSLDAFGDSIQTKQRIDELSGAESYTFECWVRTQREAFGVIYSVQVDDAQQLPAGVAAARLETCSPVGQIGPANHLRFVHVGTSVQEQLDGVIEPRKGIYSDSPHQIGQWTHIAVVKAGDQLTLFVDGRVHSQATEETTLLNVPLQITLGKHFGDDASSPALSRQFLGQIDEFAVYDYPLTADAIRAHAMAGRLWIEE